ncbi:transposase family protein [Candidatus Micrarchaeota archaeon]|nr:transposase family protein [Candidatus Micrarchaeota archaeon]
MAKVLRERGLRVSHHRIHAVLKEHGFAKKEPKKSKRRKWIRWQRQRSNSLWHADYSEINGKHVLIVEDDASRFIVGYGEFTEATAENARRVFAQAFAVYGLPRQVLTDHGSQFCNVHDAKGEHVFSDWLRTLGVKPIYARVKHPQTNGKVERLFQTIAKGWRAFGSLKKAVQWYNDVRPHMSLELASGRLRTPAQAYAEKRGKK